MKIRLNYFPSIIIPVVMIVVYQSEPVTMLNSRPGNEYTDNKRQQQSSSIGMNQGGQMETSAPLHDPLHPPSIQHEHQQQFRPGGRGPFNGPMNPGMMVPMNPGMMGPMNPYGGVGGGVPGLGGSGCKVRCDRICDPQNPYQGCQTRCFRECCSIEPMMLGPGPGMGGHGIGNGPHLHNGRGPGFNGPPPYNGLSPFPGAPPMYPMKSKPI